MFGRIRRFGSLLLLGAAPALWLADGAAAQTVDYTSLTNSPSDVPNLFAEPFTGIVIDTAGRFYALNPNGNTIMCIGGGPPRLDIGTGLNPVSIAVMENRPNPGDKKLLVVCRGTQGLFLHDAASGRIEGYRQLEGEPADIAYDADSGLAFVACQGTNAVLQFDPLSTASPVRYAIPIGERPGFLYLDPGNPGPADDRVYVAAAVTGNNTVTFDAAGVDPNFATVLDLTGNPGGELDDHDVYCIDPVAGTLTPVVKRCGSLLFDLERNPSDGNLWILGTRSLNQDPNRQSEPLLKGNFVVNQAVLVPGVTGTTLVTAPAGIDLDDYDPNTAGAQYDSCRSVNQARALDFHLGGALVASPFSDVIPWLDAAGNRALEFHLPAGSQCYDIEPYGSNLILALCLGSMRVEVLQALPFVQTPITHYDLGIDPTPLHIRHGRDVFLDGSLSEKGRSSCASCHAAARTDQLGWQLSGLPNDLKDVMVTQSLLGIADTFPHHWRGERDLKDFQKAFPGLLGAVNDGGCGRAITDPEMDDLDVFFQSLLAPSNPNQSPARKVDDGQSAGNIDGSSPVGTGSAVNGKTLFESLPVLSDGGGLTCSTCHIVETGGNGNLFPVNQGRLPRGITTEVAHLRQLQNKGRFAQQISLDTDGNGTLDLTKFVNKNGFGTGHEGGFATLAFFVQAFSISTAQATDVIRFIDQFDQGLSAGAQWAAWYDASSGSSVPTDVGNYLIQGAAKDWNDLAVIGRYDSGSGLQPMRWWYDAHLGTGYFVAETTAVPDLDWVTMQSKVASNLAQGVFLGLPPGAGRRFAIDYDGDGIRNGNDSAPWVPSYSNNGQNPSLVSWKVDLSTARMAKLVLHFSEDVTYTVSYQARANATTPGPLRQVSRQDFVVHDTITLPHSEPSTAAITGPAIPVLFDASITMTDRNGNVTGPVALGSPTFQSLPFQPPNPLNLEPDVFHVQKMTALPMAILPGGSVRFRIETEVRMNKAAPEFKIPPTTTPEMVFFTVAHDLSGSFQKPTLGTGIGQMTTPLPTSFLFQDPTAGVIAYRLPPGQPWIVSPFLDVNGKTTIEFRLFGLPSGTKVRVSAMGILPKVGMSGTNPVFGGDGLSIGAFQMLLTEEFSIVEMTVP